MKKRLEPLQPTENFRVEYAINPQKPNMPSSHYHNCYEVYFFLGNNATYFIENKSFHVNTYDVIFIDKFTYHKTWYQDDETRERFVIYFNDEALKKIEDKNIIAKILNLFDKKKISFPGSFNKYMLQELNKNIYPAFSKKASTVSKLRAHFSLLGLFLSMIDLVDRGYALENHEKYNSKEQRIAQVINYINSNYMKNITLDILCERFFVSKYYLCHSFKEITGVSIMDFITEKRLMEAEKLLRYSNLNITNIAQAVGYNSVSYFITLFKQKYNCTPAAFRKNLTP